MWVCYRRRYVHNVGFGLVMGRWYEVSGGMELVNTVPIATLSADGEDVRVPASVLMFRETKPEYAFAYQVAQMGPVEDDRLLSWLPVCPEGHQGNAVPNLAPDTFVCPECNQVYEISVEDSALVLRENE